MNACKNIFDMNLNLFIRTFVAGMCEPEDLLTEIKPVDRETAFLHFCVLIIYQLTQKQHRLICWSVYQTLQMED